LTDQKTAYRTLVAYHEAGHAVVAYDQGVRVHGISIVPDEGRMGHARIDTLLLNRLVPSFPFDKGARNRFAMERHVMVLLGGSAAVHRLDPAQKVRMKGISPCEGSDSTTAKSLVDAFTSGEEEAEKYYQWLEARTGGIMANPWKWYQVQRLAEELLANEKLGARKVREVIREAGRQWHSKYEKGKV
jgi:hypothetical protein